MGNISITTPADGETIDAADVATPLNTIVNEVNGNISNVNIASDAAIAGSKLADASVTPAKRSGGFKMGSIAGSSVLNTTGNKAITGVGFTPKLVRLKVMRPANTGSTIDGEGAMTTSTQYVVMTSNDDTVHNQDSLTDACIGWITASSSTTTPSLLASYVSMDADGFTINVSTAANNFDLIYEAYA